MPSLAIKYDIFESEGDLGIKTTRLKANIGGQLYARQFSHVSDLPVFDNNIIKAEKIKQEEIFVEGIKDMVTSSWTSTSATASIGYAPSTDLTLYSSYDVNSSTIATTSSWHYIDRPVSTSVERTATGCTVTFSTDTLYFDDASSGTISGRNIGRNSDGYLTITYGENSIVYFDGIDFTRYEPSFHEEMQFRINREWERYCRKEREEERKIPELKANRLLKLIIGEDQAKVYDETGRIFVKGKNGLYHVKRGGGVSKIEGNKVIDFCVHLDHKYGCPPTDHAIALKLMLEDDDSKVIELANRMGESIIDKLPIAACS